MRTFVTSLIPVEGVDDVEVGEFYFKDGVLEKVIRREFPVEEVSGTETHTVFFEGNPTEIKVTAQVTYRVLSDGYLDYLINSIDYPTKGEC